MTSYASAMAFRQALEQRLMNEARARPEVPLVRLRKTVAFEFLLRRLLAHRPGYWLTKGGFALQLRFGLRARATKDIDLWAAGAIDEAERSLREAAHLDVGDFFTFEIRAASTELLGAPGGGRRLPARSLLAGRRFEDFHVDLGCGDPVVGPVEFMRGHPIIEVLGCPPIDLPVYPVASTIAEKLHAYTLPRTNENTRVRDLVDLLLLSSAQNHDAIELSQACRATFGSRSTHAWPPVLVPPPPSWEQPYRKLREETGLAPETVAVGYEELAGFLTPVLSHVPGIWEPESRRWCSP